MRLLRTTLFLCLCLGGAACREAPPPADLVLRGGTIVTLDPSHPRGQALAARGGRIVAIGSEDEIAPLLGPRTRVLDLTGKTAYPGFIEGHGHLTGLGRARRTVDVSQARTWEEVVELIRREAERRPAGSWVLGWGWHQEKWDRKPQPNVEGYPTHAALSQAVPDHPVILKHAAGGHLGIVNAAALRLARIDRRTPDPAGGEILHDGRGEPTGVLRENAYDLALRAYESTRTPEQRAAETRLEVTVAMEECLRKGITSFQDLHSPFADIDVFRAMAAEGKLPVRLYVMVQEPNQVLRARLKDYRWIGLEDDHLTVRAIKKQIDGALGAHGAWLLEPYADLPSSSGLETETVADIEEAADIALEHGFQLAVHAIGDRANRETLDLFARAFQKRPPKEPPRFRIEHAQLLHPADVPRFKELDVLASMQGIHCTSDGPWVPTRIGEDRARERAYVWRSLTDAGARVSNGTDCPIEDPDPVANFAASVTRRMGDGRAFHPEQRMSREEALRSLTSNAAFAAFEEDVKGTLSPGRYADVTVLDQDLLAVPDDALRRTRVVATIVGGQVLYEAR
ncbi:MAG TPA: amidohydrolase [Candidatus Polarisedimenticolaceae bacterium]|nr:amidohydrolase [Candidatus Polarisedimenticolaceae bacterium]